jgi:8-oxo-dGTP pyrophosphatase MutT (NUDIX family)
MKKKGNFNHPFKHNDVCNNCGKLGHLFRHCKLPITSFGVIQFRIHKNVRQYLLIRRKDTLGYIDFMRGKYSIHDRDYIISMMKQMTNQEKENLKNIPFEILWKGLWNSDETSNSTNKTEQENSNIKFQFLKSTSDLVSIIDESNKSETWEEPEWGFPKGRRNYQENDYDCALREMREETGYLPSDMINIRNVLSFEEIFTGSNYKNYKHKYYLMYMLYEKTLNTDNYDSSEISLMEWKTFDECINSIRPYNIEKKRLITRIENMLLQTWIE